MERYGKLENIKKKFGVSTQHYSFAVKAFVELLKKYDTSRYELAIPFESDSASITNLIPPQHF